MIPLKVLIERKDEIDNIKRALRQYKVKDEFQWPLTYSIL
jgi:hypothetical protein